MIHTLNWKKGFFSCTFQLFSGGMPVGKLKDSEFNHHAVGSYKSAKVTFKTRGWMLPKTNIIDQEDHDFLGQIKHSCWRPKATINLPDRQLHWSYDNIWGTRWSISDDTGVRLSYRGWAVKGSINSQAEEDLLVLAGLYISNYYWRQAAILYSAVFLWPFLLFWLL